jgi:BlaI family penicillinase repressor
MNISVSEYEILSLMWAEKRGLTAVQINELAPNKSWKDISIHLIINSMLDKGFIKAEGMVRSGKVYSRLFVPTLSPEEYSYGQVTENAAAVKNKSAVYTGLFSALIEGDDISSSDMDKIEALIKRKKEGN